MRRDMTVALRFGITASVLTALFWIAWQAFVADVPTVHEITLYIKQNGDTSLWHLPFAISRWWDVPVAFVFGAIVGAIVAELTSAKYSIEQEKDLLAALAFGLVVGLFVLLVFGLLAGLLTGLVFGLLTGLVAGLSFELLVVLAFGLVAGLLAALAFGLVFGLLLVGLALGIVIVLLFGLALGIVIVLLFGLFLVVCYLFNKAKPFGRWLLAFNGSSS